MTPEYLNTVLQMTEDAMSKPKTTIDVICYGCGKYLHSKDGQGQSGVSHSLCERCKDEALAELDELRVP